MASCLTCDDRRSCGLLSTLLLRPNTVVSLDRLTDELWPDEPPAKPAEAVQELVYQLRKVIEAGRPRGTLLERQGDGYRIAVGRDELDRDRFERLVRAATEAKQRGDLDSASWTLREALSIWRGPPLANVPVDPASVTSAEVERLKEMHLNVLMERLEIDLELGFEAETITELEPLVAEHPLDERLRALLMSALYRAGRQADALSVYQQIRSTLVDEIGIDPGRGLQTLQQQILRQDPELDRPLGTDSSVSDSRAVATASRTVVVCGTDVAQLDSLLAIGEPLGRSQLARDLIAVLLLPPGSKTLDEGGLARSRSDARSCWRAERMSARPRTSPLRPRTTCHVSRLARTSTCCSWLVRRLGGEEHLPAEAVSGSRIGAVRRRAVDRTTVAGQAVRSLFRSAGLSMTGHHSSSERGSQWRWVQA